MPSLWKASLGVPLVLVLLVQAVHLVCRKEYRALTKGGVVVTGASTGIGHHAAVSLAKAGYVVYAGVRKQKDADTIAAQKVPGLQPIILDVTKQDTIDMSVSTVKADLGAHFALSCVRTRILAAQTLRPPRRLASIWIRLRPQT